MNQTRLVTVDPTGRRISSDSSWIRPQVHLGGIQEISNDPRDSSSAKKSSNGRRTWIAVIVVVAVCILVAGAIAVAVVVTVPKKTTPDAAPTASTAATASPSNVLFNQTNPIAVPLVGNFTIPNKQPAQVDSLDLCSKISQGATNYGLNTNGCTINELRPGSTKVRYTLDIIKQNNEQEAETKKRGVGAVTQLLANEAVFGYQVDQSSVSFDGVNNDETAQPSTVSVILTGNYTILNKAFGQVDATSICSHIRDGAGSRIQVTNCRILGLSPVSPSGVKVRFSIEILKNPGESDDSALRRASAALVVIVIDDTVYEVDPSSFTFDLKNGVTQNTCSPEFICAGQNVQCVTVINGATCVCRLGYRRTGSDNNCYKKGEAGSSANEVEQQRDAQPAASQQGGTCSNFTWVKVPNAYWSSYTYNSYSSTPAACQEACLSQASCTGITWYFSGGYYECRLVTSLSLYYSSSYTYYTHYTLLRNQNNCVDGGRCVYVWIGSAYQQAFGATRRTDLTTLASCVSACQTNLNCSAVDWDTYSYYCWLFINVANSSLTRYHPNIYHFDKICRDPLATTTIVPTSSRFPSVCPYWATGYCEPTGECLFSYQMCDKNQDCPNDIDETNCTCDSNHYQCPNGRCIYKSWMCDGVKDCPLGDDESSPLCAVCNSSQQFLCAKNNSCISSNRRCDGVADCSDSSDENFCLSFGGNSSLVSNLTVVVNATYRGTSGYFLCFDSWEESTSDAVCRHMGYGNALLTSYRFLPDADKFLGLTNESSSDPNIMAHLTVAPCSSKRAVALSCADIDCGTRGVPPDSVGPYIINGQRAKLGAWPWQVLYEIGYYYSDYFDWYSYCGGTLLNDRWILTAGHCTRVDGLGLGYSGLVRPANVRISLGSVSRMGDNDTVHARIDMAFTHPNYITGSYTDNDVGLLRLSEPVNFTDYIRPICLPSPLEDLSRFKVCVDTGFGRTTNGDTSDYLLQARMNVVPYRDCYYYYGYYYLRSQTQICIGTLPTEYDNNICLGDSGGPFACQDYNGDWKVIGVNSYVINVYTQCGRSIVARVTAFVDWIQQTMAANSV